MCMAVSAVEGVDISGGGGSFRLPRRKYGTSFLIRQKCTAFPLFSLRVTRTLSPAYVWPLIAKNGS